MAALASDRAHTVILLFPEVKQAYPLSTLAFTQAQGSKQKITNHYRQAHIVEKDGRFYRFEQVKILGPLGTSFGRRVLSYLTGTWQVHVKLSASLDYSLEQSKRLLIDCMDSRVTAENFDFESLAEHQKFIESIRVATSFDTLLKGLVLSAPENSLDLL